MDHWENKACLHIGYLMQNGAVDLSQLSGPQLHIKSVIHGLQKRGHQVRTVAYQDSRLLWSDNLEDWKAVSYGFSRSKWFRLIESPLRRLQYEIKLPYVGCFESLRYADGCRQHLRGVDLLFERHGYMGYGGIIASRYLGVPLVVELNGNIIHEIDALGIQMSEHQRSLGKWITHCTWHAANHLVVVSRALKLQLVRLGFPGDKVSVVLNGVNVDLFTRPYDNRLTRDQYGLGTHPVVAFVGSFQPWHGVDLLVEGFAHLHDQLPDAKLVLIGDGEGRQAVLEQAGKLALNEEVVLTGRLDQEQVAALLSAADVLVAPYPYKHSEIVGTPLKLLEYMAAGKAILASSAPLHEVIEDGTSGLRVAAADAGALAQGMLRLLNDHELRAKLGQNARRIAIQQYSWGRTIEKLEKIFQAQISNRRAINQRPQRAG
jgi:glycosyltransferase involved in cell wall biosynthesis